MLSCLKHLLCFNLVLLEVMLDFSMLLVHLHYHALILLHDLDYASEDLNCHISNLLVLLTRQTHNLLSTNQVELVHAPC